MYLCGECHGIVAKSRRCGGNPYVDKAEASVAVYFDPHGILAKNCRVFFS